MRDINFVIFEGHSFYPLFFTIHILRILSLTNFYAHNENLKGNLLNTYFRGRFKWYSIVQWLLVLLTTHPETKVQSALGTFGPLTHSSYAIMCINLPATFIMIRKKMFLENIWILIHMDVAICNACPVAHNCFPYVENFSVVTGFFFYIFV